MLEKTYAIDYIAGAYNCVIVVLSNISAAEQHFFVEFSEDEKLVCQDIPVSKRLDWCLGRVAAKRAFQKYIVNEKGIVDTRKIIVQSGNGSPIYIIDGKVKSDLKLSISHTRGKYGVALIVPNSNCHAAGIDIETIRPFSREMVLSICTDSEYLYWNAAAEARKDQLATTIWSLKESYLKALGSGFRVHPRKIDTMAFFRSSNSVSEAGIQSQWTTVGGDSILSMVYIPKLHDKN